MLTDDLESRSGQAWVQGLSLKMGVDRYNNCQFTLYICRVRITEMAGPYQGITERKDSTAEMYPPACEMIKPCEEGECYLVVENSWT